MNHESEIIEKIKMVLDHANTPYEIQGVFGVYDIIVKISAGNDDTLRRIVLEKLRKIEHIESAMTMMVNEAQEIMCQ